MEDRRGKPKRVDSQDQETEEGHWGRGGSSADGISPLFQAVCWKWAWPFS